MGKPQKTCLAGPVRRTSEPDFDPNCASFSRGKMAILAAHEFSLRSTKQQQMFPLSTPKNGGRRIDLPGFISHKYTSNRNGGRCKVSGDKGCCDAVYLTSFLLP